MGDEQLTAARLMLCLAIDLLLCSSVNADGRVRLTGSTPCSGRVEVLLNNMWGTVCGDYWELNDAEVVCRQVGCGTALRAHRSAHFGPGVGQIWLDDVACTGEESSIMECEHEGLGVHNCGHDEDARVICSEVFIRLTGPNHCSGRLEIYYNKSWGVVCNDEWGLEDTAVACRQLGCGSALLYLPQAYFGEGTGPIWLDDVACSGNEASLTECQHNGFGKHNCKHTEDTGVICSGAMQPPSINVSTGSGWLSRDPGGFKVTRGFSLTCSTELSGLPGSFYLVFEGSERNRTEPAVNNSASFHFPVAEYEHQGNYSCVYEVAVSSWNFTSPVGEPIAIIIEELLWLMISLVGVGILGPILLVLLGVCLVCIGVPFKQPEALGPTQMTVMPSCGAIEEDEDEGTYMNLQTMDAQSKTQGGEDAHDYEDVDLLDNYIRAIEFDVVPMHSSDESSNDQDAYENMPVQLQTNDGH